MLVVCVVETKEVGSIRHPRIIDRWRRHNYLPSYHRPVDPKKSQTPTEIWMHIRQKEERPMSYSEAYLSLAGLVAKGVGLLVFRATSSSASAAS